jgi:DNA-binding transcriptional MerR regulator
MKRYTVKEVCQELGICRNTLYYWETHGKIPKPKREPISGYRYWTEKDLNELKRRIK